MLGVHPAHRAHADQTNCGLVSDRRRRQDIGGRVDRQGGVVLSISSWISVDVAVHAGRR